VCHSATVRQCCGRAGGAREYRNQTERHCGGATECADRSVLRAVRPRLCRRSAAVTRPLESFGQSPMRRGVSERCLATCLSTSSDPCAWKQIDRQGSARRAVVRADGVQCARG
jgi:hypothetical protein